MFQNQPRAELRENIVDAYYSFIRVALATAQVANSICHLVAAALLFGAAYYIAAVPAQQAPIWNVIAFMAGWWGIAIGCEGLNQLESRDRRLEPLLGVDFAIAPSTVVDRRPLGYGSAQEQSGHRASGTDLEPPPPDGGWLEELLRMPRTPRVPS